MSEPRRRPGRRRRCATAPDAEDPVERVVLLRLRAGRWLLRRLVPPRPLPEPLGVAWWTAGIVRHGPARPLLGPTTTWPCRPGSGLSTASDRGRGGDRPASLPLQEFRLRRAPHGGAAAWPPARGRSLRRRRRGTPSRSPFDLTWTTDGVPYHYDRPPVTKSPAWPPATSPSAARPWPSSTGTASATTPGACVTGGPSDGAGTPCASTTARAVDLADIRMLPDVPVFFGARADPAHRGASGHRPDRGRGAGATTASRPAGGSTSPPRPPTTWASTSRPWPSGRCCCATTRTAGPAGSRGPWCAAGPTTAVPAPVGSSGTSPSGLQPG